MYYNVNEKSIIKKNFQKNILLFVIIYVKKKSLNLIEYTLLKNL